MAEKFGVEGIKKVLGLLVEIGNVVDKIAKEQGGIVGKLSHLSALSDEVMTLINLDVAAFKAEFADLDAAEKEQLLAFVRGKLELADDKIEQRIEGALALVVKGSEFVKEVIAFAKPAAESGAV